MKSRSQSKQAPPRRNRKPIFILLLIPIIGIGIWQVTARRAGKVSAGGGAAQQVEAKTQDQQKRDDALVSALVRDEETHLALMPKMRLISASVYNLQLPGAAGDMFAPMATVSDLGTAPELKAEGALVSRAWPVVAETAQAEKVDLWRPLLDSVKRFEHAKVFIGSGTHPEGDGYRFESEGGFEALAQLKSGDWCALDGKVKIDWQREKNADGSAGPWRISRWKTESMQWSASPKRLFVEALDAAMRGGQNAAKLRRSLHYETVLKYYRDPMQKMPHPYFAPISVNQKEGIAIADVNGDGFDDIYITVRLGKNMLLVNQKDGTFVEQAAQFKLDLPGHTTRAPISRLQLRQRLKSAF